MVHFFLPCLMTGPRVGWHPGRNDDAPGPAAKDDAAEGVEGAVSIPRDIPIDMSMSKNRRSQLSELETLITMVLTVLTIND